MRTYYMHTLDGKPAQFCEVGEDCYIAFAGGRGKAPPLATSLQQIRREQRRAIDAASRDRYQQPWADSRRYGYVRVAVPDARDA